MRRIFYYQALAGVHLLQFSQKLREMLTSYQDEYQDIVLLCVGSDRSTGDSLGPLIGHKLKRNLAEKIFIYGTLEKPVHAMNLNQVIQQIYQFHEKPLVIAIDASLGTEKHVGYVTLTNAPLRPGLGVKKSLPEVGDICITGIVNQSGVMDGMVLQSTRLSIVMTLAEFISTGILLAVHSHSSSSMTWISR